MIPEIAYPQKGPGTTDTLPPEGTWYRHPLPPERDLVPEIPYRLAGSWYKAYPIPPPRDSTHACENITFPLGSVMTYHLSYKILKSLHGQSRRGRKETDAVICLMTPIISFLISLSGLSAIFVLKKKQVLSNYK